MDFDSTEDIAVMDDTAKGLQETTDDIAMYSAYGCLKMNTKIMRTIFTGKDTSQQPLLENRNAHITVHDNSVN